MDQMHVSFRDDLGQGVSLPGAGRTNHRSLFQFAAPALILATMAGCSGASYSKHVSAAADRMSELAAAQAKDAEKAIAARDAGKAIAIAEAAVAANPTKADYRVLLGRAYLLGGRYDSARTAFSDALTLGSSDSRAIVNLALVDTAQGRSAEARGLLDEHINQLSAADYGLAMAMAGAPDEAIQVLSQAIHDPNATSRERQNLAYAFALGGHWAEARQVASLDLPPLEAAKRVMGWAETAQPGAESRRVIAMIGVSPRGDDAGLPVRLALAAPGNQPVRLADAAADAAPVAGKGDDQTMLAAYTAAPDYSAPLVAESAPAPRTAVLASASALPSDNIPSPASSDEAATVAAPKAVPASFVPMRRSEAVHALKVRLPMVAATEPRAAMRPAGLWQPVNPGRGSSWVVQLGAFTTREGAQASRAVFLKRNAALRAFPMIDSSINLEGRAYYRVAIAGFGDRAGADALCDRIRARGNHCFVRLGGPEAAPGQWAKALRGMQPQQLAMR